MHYPNRLTPIAAPPPLLADFPEYVEPVQADRRFLASPLVDDANGSLRVRSWRFRYNARGIIEMENRLDPAATAVLVVHPWGVDDGHGLRSPQPAGVAFFCTVEKNRIAMSHMRDVLDPFLQRLRDSVARVAYSLPGSEDEIRRQLYASVRNAPDASACELGEERFGKLMLRHPFKGDDLPSELVLDAGNPVRSYFEKTPSTDAGATFNGPGFWDLPMPIASPIQHAADDLVFYDAEGYDVVRDYLKQAGVRHILLCGYATDMCVARTTCGYENLSKDFNLFLVGDATLATFPGSTTPRFATQVALMNAALRLMITQVGWVRRDDE